MYSIFYFYRIPLYWDIEIINTQPFRLGVYKISKDRNYALLADTFFGAAFFAAAFFVAMFLYIIISNHSSVSPPFKLNRANNRFKKNMGISLFALQEYLVERHLLRKT